MTTALLFPGQGSQAVGMGRDMYEASPAARAVFDTADQVLGFALSQLCFAGPPEALLATANAQPAILTVSAALLAALAEAANTTPVAFVAQHAAFVAGHSLGEYSALVAAGALDLPTALRLVRRRGELMAAADQGAMAAIIGIDPLLEAVCAEASLRGEQVVIANYNAPDQLVISGDAAAVERAITLAKARGARRALLLKVSAAFHSPLMQAASDGLAGVLAEAAIGDPQVPLVANVTGLPLHTAAAIRDELCSQVTAPVRWIASVEYMAAAGVDRFVEIGPGSVLTGLVKRIVPGRTWQAVNDWASVQAFG